MESVGSIHHQRPNVLNHHRFAPLPGNHRSHPPPSIRLHSSRTAPTRFPSLSVASSSASTQPSPPPPRREPASLPDLLLAAAKPVLISLTAAAAVLLAAPLLRRSSYLAHAVAASPQTATSSSFEKQKQQGGKGASSTDDAEQERVLESKLSASPDDRDALRGLLELRVRQKRVAEAIDLANSLAALDPGDTEMLLLRAHLHNYAGDTNSSRAAFEEIIQKDPAAVGAYHGLVMLAAQAEEEGEDGEVEKVMARVTAALTRCKEEGRMEEMRDFRLLLAQVRVMEGEYERALQVYKELVKEEPRDFRPYLCQGVIYTMLDKEAEAEKQFDEYRKLVPKGHPYAEYFDENMASIVAFRQLIGSKRN